MKSSVGNSIQLSLFGESHGEAIGCVVTGLCAGIKIDLEHVNAMLERRKAKSELSTARQEPDEIRIVSGFFNGYTTGTPLCILIENKRATSGDYESTKDIARPSHADYTAEKKYHGFQDYRGGGHFSGRLTAPIVAVGAICSQILQNHGIRIGSHIAQCHSIKDEPFSADVLDKQIAYINKLDFPALSKTASELMAQKIRDAKAVEDSVGGIIESAVIGIPAGIGEPFFYSVESVLSQLLFSIPAIKGVEFGAGFGMAELMGSEANDPFININNNIMTKTNNNGGINGGITNGMPIIIKTAIKPTPSIFKAQESINIKSGENVALQLKGRHDPAIIHRGCVVVDSMIAFGLLDLITERFGYEWHTSGGCL